MKYDQLKGGTFLVKKDHIGSLFLIDLKSWRWHNSFMNNYKGSHKTRGPQYGILLYINNNKPQERSCFFLSSSVVHELNTEDVRIELVFRPKKR